MAQENGQGPGGELAAVVQQLIQAAGLPLRALAQKTRYSTSSWSAYQRGERPIPREALTVLLQVASAAPAELAERAQRLLAAREEPEETEPERTEGTEPPAATASEPAPSTATPEPSNRPELDEEAPSQQHPPEELDASPQELARPGFWYRKKIVAACLLVLGIGSLVMLLPKLSDQASDRAAPSTSATPSNSPTTDAPTTKTTSPEPNPTTTTQRPSTEPAAVAPSQESRTPPTRRPRQPPPTASTPPAATSSPACQERAQYTVDRAGNVVDENDKPLGPVSPGDHFIRDDSPGHPLNPSRYYGAVEEKRLSGYVMAEKLTRSGTVCV